MDGTGDVALPIADTSTPEANTTAELYDSSGAPTGRAFDDQAQFLSSTSGFLMLSRVPWMSQYQLTGLDAHGGALGGSGPLDGTERFIAQDGTGSAVIAGQGVNTPGPTMLFRFDLQARPLASVPIRAGEVVIGMGTDVRANTLLLTDGTSRFGSGTVAGYWIDANGQAGPEFSVARVSETPCSGCYMLEKRVGGGLFLKDSHGDWLAQIDALATQASAPPEWLARKPGVRIVLVHSGAAYALVEPQATGTHCTQSVDVVSSVGQSCGTAQFPCGMAQSGLSIGYDGTVVVNGDDQSAAPQHTCHWQWWTRFFR
jgi:hypothetical protein